MSTPAEALGPGSTILRFRLVSAVGTSVWKAEDTGTGKQVALKILTRQLPKDTARRDAMIRDARQSAALYSAFLVNILEVAPAGDMLLLVMDWVDGEPSSRYIKGRALNRTAFFRLAYQLAEGVRLLHSKNLVHQNINGDTVLVTPAGQVKLTGFNLQSLIGKRDGPSPVYQQKANDQRSVMFMSPEQIAGQVVDAKSDIFSMGSVFYELATGKPPYQGNAPNETAQLILEGQPASPKALNPQIDTAVLNVMGRCLFKDPNRRHKDVKSMVDDIAKEEPEAAKVGQEMAKVVSASPQAAVVASRKAILFIAEVAEYEEMARLDQSGAAKAAARMQQILGEAVYLFDGQVVDPFGPRMVGELPTVENALEAARKGEFDFSPAQQEGERVNVRLLLHAGEVSSKEGAITGDAIARAADILPHLTPNQVFVSEDFAKVGRGNVRLRDVGARGGVKLYGIAPVEPESHAAPTEIEEPLEEEVAEAGAAAAPGKKKKKSNMMMAAVAAAVVVVLGIAGAFFMRKPQEEAPVVAQARPVGPQPATAAHPRNVHVGAVTAEGADPLLAPRAQAMQLAAAEVLKSFPEIRVVDAPGDGVTSVEGKLVTGATGPELTVGSGATKSAPVPAADVASGVQALVQLALAEVKAPPHAAIGSVEALNAFADFVTARAANDTPKADVALHAAVKADPNFLAAQLTGMRFFAANGNDKDAVLSARLVSALDPSNMDALRTVLHASLKEGSIRDSMVTADAILAKIPSDSETLNIIGHYALAARNEQKFRAAMGRLQSAPDAERALHEPDLLVNAGRMEGAIDQYYDIEIKSKNNPALSLKIGRISVLRRSQTIADLELEKLKTLDPDYGYHLLKAYMTGAARDRAGAEAELKLAAAGARPGNDIQTASAEIYAFFGDTSMILSSLEKAAAQREPTAAYVLADPLFAFLQSDPRFLKIRASLAAQQQEIQDALTAVRL